MPRGDGSRSKPWWRRLDDARPAWKLLRVLGNLLSLEGFDYLDSASVCTDVKAASEASLAFPSRAETPAAIVPEVSKSLCRVGNQPMYAVDTLVRRAPGLQATGHAEEARVRIHPSLGKSLSLAEGDRALAKQNGSSAEFAVQLDVAVPPSCVHLPAGLPNTVAMGPSYGNIELVKA